LLPLEQKSFDDVSAGKNHASGLLLFHNLLEKSGSQEAVTGGEIPPHRVFINVIGPFISASYFALDDQLSFLIAILCV